MSIDNLPQRVQLSRWVSHLVTVHHPSLTRQIYGRLCAAFLVVLAIGGMLAVVAGVVDRSPSLRIVLAGGLTMLVAPVWQLNRRGHLAGPVAVVAAATLLTTVASASSIPPGGPPIVPLGVVVPVILAAFLVHPLASYAVVGVTVVILMAGAGAQQLPTDAILLFGARAGVQLSLVATLTASLAWALAAALRSAVVSRSLLEQRSAERTALLEAQNDRARRLLDERKSLYSSVAHDLRNDAARLIDLVDQLIEAWHAGDVAEAAAHERRLFRFVHRQAAYARDLSDVSLVAEGVTLPMHPTVVDLSELAVRLVDDLLPEARCSQITMSVETRPGVTAAWCDPDRSERVLRNLIGNAITAVKVTGEAGAVTIVISRESGELLRCEVIDTGCGIAPEELRRLGHRFARVRLPGIEGDGLGMGLTLSAQLVALMGGALHLSSPGRGFGAVATFTLPICPGQVEPAPAYLRELRNDQVACAGDQPSAGAVTRPR